MAPLGVLCNLFAHLHPSSQLLKSIYSLKLMYTCISPGFCSLVTNFVNFLMYHSLCPFCFLFLIFLYCYDVETGIVCHLYHNYFFVFLFVVLVYLFLGLLLNNYGAVSET